MSVFAFILLLPSGTHPDRRSRMWASDGRRQQWAEGESGEEGAAPNTEDRSRMGDVSVHKWSVSSYITC
jgi:hypothetical protein